MQSHKKPSSLEFLRNNTLKFSIHILSIFLFVLFCFVLFFFILRGKVLAGLTEASIIDEKKFSSILHESPNDHNLQTSNTRHTNNMFEAQGLSASMEIQVDSEDKQIRRNVM